MTLRGPNLSAELKKELREICARIVAPRGKGILAADESTGKATI